MGELTEAEKLNTVCQAASKVVADAYGQMAEMLGRWTV